MLISTLFAYFISVKAGLNIVAGISTQQLELRNTLYLGLLLPLSSKDCLSRDL